MSGRLLFVRYERKILSCLLQDNRLVEVSASEPEGFCVGDIVIGKVKNVVKNIGAAFIDIGNGQLCFLPFTNLSEKKQCMAGDEIVVQIEKAAVKTKEAVVTTNLSFAGKYAVVTTGKKKIGFSSKLSMKQKTKLKQMLEACEIPFGVVIRTNAGSLEDEHILIQELKILSEECENLLQVAKHRTCFSVLKKAVPPYLKLLRDSYSDCYEKIITDDRQLYEEIQLFLQENQSEDLHKLEFYVDEKLSLMNLYSINSKLEELISSKVWLKSGGYLIIEPTEALTVIDVNSGKYSGKKNMQETCLFMNHEACFEIARQLRARNLSGIIIIDFINMEQEEDKRKILDYLHSLLKKDPVQCRVIDMTPLGLVELTRKKINKSLKEQLM